MGAVTVTVWETAVPIVQAFAPAFAGLGVLFLFDALRRLW
jgi:hypothetical protein